MTDAVDSPQGRRIECISDAVRKEAVELAFDYRGDVSVELDDGSTLVGYLANRDASAQIPWIEIFPTSGAEKQRLAVSRIRSLAFTGIDTAAGKTWEAWLKKVAEAEANGQIAELYPQDLDKPQ